MSHFFKVEDDPGHPGWPMPPWWAYIAGLLFATAVLILVNSSSK